MKPISEAEFSRMKQALDLRSQGRTYLEIAGRLSSITRGTLGVSGARARQIIMRALRVAQWVAGDRSRVGSKVVPDPAACKRALQVLEPYDHVGES